MRLSFTRIFLIFILVFPSFAKVWESERRWNVKDIESFQDWVSNQVTDTMFIDQSSPYYGIKTDCADLIFALLAIYSYENKLEYEVRLGTDRYSSSESQHLDHLEKDKRFIEFVNSLGNQIGSEGLVEFNSYPLKVESIRTGDFYGSKWQKNGKFVSHISLIRKVLPTGDFELYSSTTPKAVRKLNIRRGAPLTRHVGASWKFRRALPSYLLKNYKGLPGYSREQENINQSLNTKFFSYVKNALKEIEDNLELNLERRLFNVCELVRARDFEVRNAVSNRDICFDAKEYDLYSTVIRDRNIRKAFIRLHNGWLRIRKTDHDLPQELVVAMEQFYAGDTSGDLSELKNYCQVEVEGYNLTLKHIKDLIKRRRLQSNPNLSYLARWGLRTEANSCPRY